MKRFRIDFSVRELDVPEEQAHGIRFGDEVPITGLFEFFVRCRDAVRALYDPEIQERKKREVQQQKERLEELAARHAAGMTSRKTMRDQIMNQPCASPIFDRERSQVSGASGISGDREEYLRLFEFAKKF